jgi:uncharacterized protein
MTKEIVLSYLFIGTIIGAVMGLTGSGGALVAIPLLLLTGLSLKEASVISLVAVIMAAIINFVSQRKDANMKLSVMIMGSSLAGSFITIPLKAITPDLIISLLLALISIFSLWSIWTGSNKSYEQDQSYHWSLSVIVGFVLGGLTTLTGLGGGVLLMPIFKGIFKMPLNHAVATSLLTIAGASLISFSLQLAQGFALPDISLVALLVLGILGSSFLLKIILKAMPRERMDLVRKVVFSFVVMFALAKLFS